MIEVNFQSQKYNKIYEINFETDHYALYKMIRDYIMEHTERIEREEIEIEAKVKKD